LRVEGITVEVATARVTEILMSHWLPNLRVVRVSWGERQGCPLVWLTEVESRRWCSEADRGTTLLVLVVLGNPARTGDQGRRRGKTAGAVLPDSFAQPGITASARQAPRHTCRVMSTPLCAGLESRWSQIFFKIKSAKPGLDRLIAPDLNEVLTHQTIA
jgi:hypothetical protein